MWSVGVQHERAGLFQVPLAALQKLLTLGSGPQAQTKQLLHLQHKIRYKRGVLGRKVGEMFYSCVTCVFIVLCVCVFLSDIILLQHLGSDSSSKMEPYCSSATCSVHPPTMYLSQ